VSGAIGGLSLFHFPAGFPGSALPTVVPYGVRTFLESHLPRLRSLPFTWYAQKCCGCQKPRFRGKGIAMTNGSIWGEPFDGDFYSIQIEGDFDGSLQDIGIAVTEAALATDPRAIVIDVKSCTFLDSTAIAVILGARQRAMDANIPFALVGHNPTIDRTLELTGLSEELEILRDRTEAIAQLARG